MKKISTLIFAAFVAVSANAQVQGVDLGLSVKWGDRYVGAADLQTVGKYYAYGDPEARTNFTIDNYAYANSSFVFKNLDNLYFTTPTPDVKDVATEVAGAEFRTPTYDELNDLATKCTFTFEKPATATNESAIVKITGPNGNSINVATAGHYQGTNLYDLQNLELTCSTLIKSYADVEEYGFQYLYIRTTRQMAEHDATIGTPSFTQCKAELGTFGLCILPVSGEPAAIKNVTTDDQTSVRKFVQNGQLVIVKNGKTYNAAGALLK